MTKKWLDQQQENKEMASDTDYIRLNAGIFQIRQLDEIFSASSVLAFINKEKNLVYYKQPLNLKYTPPQVGQKWNSYLIDDDLKRKLDNVFTNLKDNKSTRVYVTSPDNTKEHFVVDTYTQVKDKTGNFSGVLQESQDIYPLIKLYLKETGQKLVDDPDNNVNIPETDTDSGASEEWT